MSDPITMDREYQTRDGREVKLFTVEGRLADYPVAGEMLSEGRWTNHTWMADGRFSVRCDRPSNADLIPKPVRYKREVWVNVYPSNGLSFYRTRSVCDLAAGPDRIACIKVDLDFQEGEGIT